MTQPDRTIADRPRKPYTERHLTAAVDRTSSRRRRAGGRHNQRLHNVPTFASDHRSAA